MARLWLFALLLFPLAEIATFIWVGGAIGVLWTLLALVATTALGVLILRLQGLGLLLDSRALLARGEIPARQFAEAMLLALAGLLLLLPGFLTDIPGFLLLLPPVRAALFAWASRHMVVVSTYTPPPGPRTIELDPTDYREDR